jgi:hypothetical protein
MNSSLEDGMMSKLGFADKGDAREQALSSRRMPTCCDALAAARWQTKVLIRDRCERTWDASKSRTPSDTPPSRRTASEISGKIEIAYKNIGDLPRRRSRSTKDPANLTFVAKHDERFFKQSRWNPRRVEGYITHPCG